MKVTIDLPADLFERARTEASERRISFDELVSEAIAGVLTPRLCGEEKIATGRRVSFPIFASRNPVTLPHRDESYLDPE
jgi:hypothetical protein